MANTIYNGDATSWSIPTAASDLSNGVTGSGAVVLANAPSFTGSTNTPTGTSYKVNNIASEQILGKSSGYAINTGSTTQNTVGSVLVPAGAMGINSKIEITWNALFETALNTPFTGGGGNNSGTTTVFFGVNTSASQAGWSQVYATAAIASGQASRSGYIYWDNQSSLSAQIASPVLTGTASLFPTLTTLNTAADTYIVFALKQSVSGDYSGLSWIVSLIP